MSGLEDFYVHTVHVQTYDGDGAWGAGVSDTPIPAVGFLDQTTTLTRNGDGDEVTSTATFRCRPTDGALFTPESRVTLHKGTPLERATTVLTVSVHDSGPLGLPDHVEVTLA